MNKILDAVIHVAKQAGDEIMRHRAAGVKAEVKQDGSFVTAADRASEDIIRAQLTPLIPDAEFIGEESVAAGRIPDISSGHYWCVDPLDGTRGFIEQTGQFGVMIALMREFRPVLGVIWLPLEKTLYAGGQGLPNFMVEDGERRDFSPLSAPSDGAVRILLEDRHRHIARQNQYVAQIPDHQIVATKNPWAFCQVAAGCADAAPYFSKCYEWDSVAQEAILAAVGGVLAAPGKKPVTYGKAPNFANGDLLACRADLLARLPGF